MAERLTGRFPQPGGIKFGGDLYGIFFQYFLDSGDVTAANIAGIENDFQQYMEIVILRFLLSLSVFSRFQDIFGICHVQIVCFLQ